MKSLQTLLVLLAAFLTMSVPSRSDDRAVHQQLEVEYLKTLTATRAKDLDRVMNHYTADFKLKVGKKILDRRQVSELVHWQIVATKEVKALSFKIQSLVVKGGTAVATVRQTSSSVVYKNKTPYLLATDQISADTWISTADGWRLKLQEVKHNVTTVDGKQIQQVSDAPI